jgi:hypothetical protein
MWHGGWRIPFHITPFMPWSITMYIRNCPSNPRPLLIFGPKSSICSSDSHTEVHANADDVDKADFFRERMAAQKSPEFHRTERGRVGPGGDGQARVWTTGRVATAHRPAARPPASGWHVSGIGIGIAWHGERVGNERIATAAATERRQPRRSLFVGRTGNLIGSVGCSPAHAHPSVRPS